MKAEDLVTVGEADRRIFGADRREVLRWALERSPEYAWIATGPVGLEGYCFGRRGFNFDQIGPVHSQRELVSQQLVKACLSSVTSGTRVIVDPFLHSPSWLEWLQERRLRSPTSVYADGSGKKSPSGHPGKNVDDVWSRVWLNDDPSTWLL